MRRTAVFLTQETQLGMDDDVSKGDGRTRKTYNLLFYSVRVETILYARVINYYTTIKAN